MNKQLKGQIDINTALKQKEILEIANRIELKQVMFFREFKEKKDLTNTEKELIANYANELSQEILEIFDQTIDKMLKKL